MQDLVKQLSERLTGKGIMVATAESCTGGLLAAALTHKPGASAYFDRGFVTYSNAAKHEELDVPQNILDDHGAVSAPTAQLMAEGALKSSNAGIAISITGIAGPDGDTSDKPVGLVFFGYALENGISGIIEHNFEGSREKIQSLATITALKTLIKLLDEN